MYLGLDLGTSSIKALLIDDDQAIVAEATAPLNVARLHSGWSEQDPGDWIVAAQTVLGTISAENDLGGVRAIGLSGQMHGATLLDRAGKVLRPCILWNDTRAHAEAAAFDADPDFRQISGNIVFPGFTAPKLAWIKTHEPDIFEGTAKVLLPKDYLRFWLTGEYVSEMSDAAGTSWLDTGRRDWSDTLLAATGLGREHMPGLVEGSDISGGLRGDIASTYGMRPGLAVAGGAGDNAASAVGVGVVKAGQAFVSLGTSGVLFAANDGYLPNPDTALHTFCHALPDRWHQMGVILAASDALAWYGRLVGHDPAQLTGELGDLTGPGRAVFLPYLGGERTPHNDAHVRAVMSGLEHATDRAAGTRAVLEGVAFAFADSFAAIAGTGARIDHLIAVGGGSRSQYWLSVIATVLGVPIHVPAAGDFGGAFGAARLAMMAAGQGGAEIAVPPPTDQIIEPVSGLGGAFQDAYQRYRATYAALKDLS